MLEKSIIKRCPTEIINLILEFHGYHKNRNGKYMRQIDVASPKYNLLRHVHETVIMSRGWGTECSFVKQFGIKFLQYVITIVTYDTYVEWIMRVYSVFPTQKYVFRCEIYEYDTIRFITHS